MDMMGIEPTMVSTPPLQHPHHAFHSPHSAFSMPSNNIAQRGMQRSHSITPNSMMRQPLPHQNLIRQSPVPFHNMQTMNHHSPHPQTTPIPEIHPSSYPPQEHHYTMSPTLSCPIRESPHNLMNNTPVNITHQEIPPPHTLCYTQPPIYNQFKPQQVHTPPHTSILPSNFTSNTQALQLTDSSIHTVYPQQVSTPITYTPTVSVHQQYSASLNTTDSTSSQPSLESIEYDADVENARASTDESTANLIISTRDELSDLTVSPAPLPFSVVVTSIATSSHDNLSDSSNFPTSPTGLSSPNSKFPLNKERKAMDKKMRREIANCNERKRMENINSGFRCLKVLLPQSQNEKTSKAAILQQTSKYIHKLVEEKRRLLEENDKFKHELSKYMVGSQYGGVMGKNPAFIQPNSGFQPFNSSAQISKPDEYYSRMQDEVGKLQEQLKHERNSKCMLEKINRELESRVGFMESVHSYNADPLLASREAHCKNNVDAIVMSLEQLEGDCFTNHNRPLSQPSVYEGQTPYIEIMDRSTTPYIDRNTPVGHFRAIKSPMPHH